MTPNSGSETLKRQQYVMGYIDTGADADDGRTPTLANKLRLCARRPALQPRTTVVYIRTRRQQPRSLLLHTSSIPSRILPRAVVTRYRVRCPDGSPPRELLTSERGWQSQQRSDGMGFDGGRGD